MKKIIITIIGMTIILSIMFGCIIDNKVSAGDKEQQYSEDYKEYLEASDEEKSKYDVVPRMYDVPLDSIYEDAIVKKEKPTLFNLFGLFAESQLVSSYAEQIPSKFDLRDEVEIKVENQNPYGICWAFPSMNALETNLRLNGYDEYDFSELHLAYIETKDIYGSRENFADGGNFTTFEHYMENEYGPVLEEEVPYNEQYTTEQYNYLTSLEARAYIEETENFPTLNKLKYNYSEQQIKLFRNKVKKHIMENGAVYAYVTVWWTQADGYINMACKQINGYYTMYTESDQNASGAHAVSIIGWDDNFPKENFISENGNKPEKDGAYLVLDSHGSDYCDNGTYWISYEDYGIEMDLNGVVKASIPYIEIVQGPTRTEYAEGESFDSTGMIVKMHRGDNESIIIDYTISDGENLQPEQQYITIQYGDYKQTQNITVYSEENVGILKFNDEALYYCVKGKEETVGVFEKILNANDEQKQIIVKKEELEKVTSLYISDENGQINDLTGLSKFYKLNTLEINGQNNISNISEITKLTNLKKIKMTGADKLLELGSLLENENITEVCIVNEFSEEDLKVEDEKIILPEYFSEIKQKENPKIRAEIEYYDQTTNEKYKTKRISVEYDEDKNLKVKLDKKVLEENVEEVRYVKIYIDEGLMAGSTSSIMYIASELIEDDEYIGEDEIIEDPSDNNNEDKNDENDENPTTLAPSAGDKEQEQEKDETVSDINLPKAGVRNLIIALILSTSCILVISAIKVYINRDVK